LGPGSAEQRFAPHRVRDTKPYSFFGTTRNVALARAMTASSALTKHCAKQIVLQACEPPPLPIHIVYPTSRLLSAKGRAFIAPGAETSDWRFG